MLYCPIEGGTYVIDAAVRELASRTGADVLVLDALDLLAGEWGPFGKAASCLQLPSNPLQLGEFQNPQRIFRIEDSDDEDVIGMPIIAQAMEGMQSGRPPFGITLRRGRGSYSNTSMQAKRAFFQDFVNLQRDTEDGSVPTTIPGRPRLIYCRDFNLLQDSLPHWYSAFLEAVRLRRQGPIPRLQAPVQNPTVIVHGISPSIITPRTAPFSSPDSGSYLNVQTNRNRPSSRIGPSAGPKVMEWDESPAAQRARDKRLHERLNNWEKHDASVFHAELPNLQPAAGETGAQRNQGKGLMSLFVAIPDGGGGLPSIAPGNPDEDTSRERSTEHSRLTVILPRMRDVGEEVNTRMQRRLDMNKVNMRTAVGSIGGDLSSNDELRPELFNGSVVDSTIPELHAMVADWSQRVETWQRTKVIADRAMGSFVSEERSITKDKSSTTLDFTPVPWEAIAKSWDLERTSRSNRKALLSVFTKPTTKQSQEGESTKPEEEEEADEEDDFETSQVEELLEQLRRDPTLDQHEQRLLGCIVNPRDLSTTFEQVHLPAVTIDSIRTIVSLPLLRPDAFSYGILKQHSMNGALLFGAPGTGKTLSIRALAKESGARMIIIKPSDVMDMYVGEGEKLVRAVFSLARKISPCVVFIDEIDALLGARYSSRGSGGDLAHRGVITEFMQEMDGLKSHQDKNVVVIGATNRPFDLDDAVLRRLPRRLLIDLPGEKDREAILRILLAGESLGEDINIQTIAKRTESFSGSDLKHLCVAAALDAVKEHAKLPWTVPRDTTPQPQELPTPIPEPMAAVPTPGDNGSPRVEEKVEAASTQTPAEDEITTEPEEAEAPRVLHMSHFEKALKEITPSASEHLGTLADLRKWNEEFGEGGRKRGKKIWGSRFGFVFKTDGAVEEGRVQQP
ncbi:hypothetical protein FRC17_003481 [Serendipita sp. 399]|nr:hypothetical protein FRC17_003481 [Serendipita sp. 399]